MPHSPSPTQLPPPCVSVPAQGGGGSDDDDANAEDPENPFGDGYGADLMGNP
jgi:hypothetical protein